MERYYKASELKIGDRVTTYEISGIYDINILLSQTKILDDGSTEGTVEFVGAEQNKEMLEVIKRCEDKYGREPMLFAQTELKDGEYSVYK